ncbi:outer membrane protein assembly factor BamE [Pseudooceanicola sp. C21-150M6]|uniref:outer membrane protein assembly factor BamE n=1 Tax=Pseudooceanicola sp. C21-150M6 TaxID=3434355 RepID=UPI003D7FA6E4
MRTTILAAARTGGAVLRGVLVLTAFLALAGCSERIRSHGYVPQDDDLEQITVGVDTRDTVTDILGSPSTSGMSDDSGLYYVRSRVRHYLYLEPKVIDREVVAVSFDPDGVVSNVERFGLEDGRPVVLSRRVTTNEAGNNGLVAQLLRNIQNFNPGAFLD